LKRDKEIFISNLFINFYRNINILILSLFANEATVGIYSAGEKIIKAIQSTFAPITQSFYPYISRISVESKKNSFKVIKYLIIVIGIFSSVIALLIYIWSDWINHLAFGNKFLDTSMVLRITSPVIMFGAVNFIIGVIFMINNNLKKEFLKSVILVGILNIIFCSFLSMKYYAIGSAVSFLMSEAFLLIIMLINIYKNKQKWVFLNEQP
jgi:PST family polysaccharide transporter